MTSGRLLNPWLPTHPQDKPVRLQFQLSRKKSLEQQQQGLRKKNSIAYVDTTLYSAAELRKLWLSWVLQSQYIRG